MISTLGALGAYVVLSVVLLYILMCGNNKLHRDGFVGSLYRLLLYRCPDLLAAALSRLFPRLCPRDRPGGCMGRGGPCRYCIFLFYLGLYAGFVVCYARFVHPNVARIYTARVALHRSLTFLVLPWPWVIVVLLHFCDPGVVTREPVNSYIALFPVDGVLYPRQLCRTLRIPAVARSRFCQYTGRRIAKYDHYCPWILAPIGLRTHRFFLLFLVANDAAAAYYAVGSWRYLRWLRAGFAVERAGGFWANRLIDFLVVVKLQPVAVGLFLLLAGVVAFMTGFVLQQLYYTARNITQVEIDKIEDWRYREQSEGRPHAVYVHAYNRGVLANLREDWFPPVAAKHAPVPLHEPPPPPPEGWQQGNAEGRTPRKAKARKQRR
jgi:hypothetical protein